MSEIPIQDAIPPPTPAVPAPQASGASAPSWLSSIIGENQLFAAGVGLMGAGVGLTMLRRGVMLSSTALQRRMLVSLEFNVKDPSYHWFLHWLSQHTNAMKSRGLERTHQLSVVTDILKRGNGSQNVAFRLVAGPGVHWLKYRGAWMRVSRERETRSAPDPSGMPWETVTLTTLSRDRDLFPKLLADARDLALTGLEGRLTIHTAWGLEWRPFGKPRRKRPLGSVVLGEGVAEKVKNDVQAFLGRRQWYADRGIPYRRGYLLHGPPGSGKSSFIQALAGELNYDICLLNLSERGLADDKLTHLMSNIPERSIVLIEDVDAAFNKRVQTSADGYQSSVTFSGFLNALDGVASGEERIIFMTTNHPEQLDPALVRPGRVDMNILVDDASPAQARQLFDKFYEGTEGVETLGEELEGLVKGGVARGRRISMAMLQGFFIRSGSKEAVGETRTYLSKDAGAAS
ncbi:mitochondrial chaperone BCS1 [Peniophora sp. CONT]|nr:mitochondrial chaperone BCS1 [Peniophora sp. CONT]